LNENRRVIGEKHLEKQRCRELTKNGAHSVCHRVGVDGAPRVKHDRKRAAPIRKCYELSDLSRRKKLAPTVMEKTLIRPPEYNKHRERPGHTFASNEFSSEDSQHPKKR